MVYKEGPARCGGEGVVDSRGVGAEPRTILPGTGGKSKGKR